MIVHAQSDGPSGGGLVAGVEAVLRRRRPDIVRVGLARLGADPTDGVVRQARAVVVRVVDAQAVEGRGARLVRREKLLHLGQKMYQVGPKDAAALTHAFLQEYIGKSLKLVQLGISLSLGAAWRSGSRRQARSPSSYRRASTVR